MGILQIIKKSIVELPKAIGGISDTLNITDKIKNAPSINLVEKIAVVPVGSVVAVEDSEAENLDEGWEEVDNPFAMRYSTEEFFTGKYWIDGKKIYGKVFNNLGTLPNAAGRKTYNWNIANINELITYDLKAIYTDGSKLTIPYVYPDTAYISNWITTEFITTGGVEIVVGKDRSSFHLKAILEYTKTTD